jgi:hypothetical protein
MCIINHREFYDDAENYEVSIEANLFNFLTFYLFSLYHLIIVFFVEVDDCFMLIKF